MAAAKKPYRVRRVPQGKGPRTGPQLHTEERIDQIIAARVEGRFRFGVTLHEFAKAWGVTYQTAKELSSLATRKMAKERNRAAVKSFLHVTLERVVATGFRDGDLKAVVSACKVLLDLRGLAAPKKTELTGKGGGPVELDVELAGAFDRVSRAVDRLAAAGGAPSPPEGAGTDAG